MEVIIKFVQDNKIILARYVLVGGTSAVIDFGLYVFFTDLARWHYLLAATLSFVVAALYNFFLNRKWTFQSNGRKRKQMPVFFAVALLGLLLNNTIILLLIERFGLWDIYSKIIATGMVTIWNFLGNKYLTFRIQ